MLKEHESDHGYVDLHIHSTFSDGTCSIPELIQAALERNLRAIAITDHDCIDGISRADEIGRAQGIEVIPGVELSCEIDGKDIHVLGYMLDIENTGLIHKLHEMKQARYARAEKMIRNLNRQGVDLRFDTVLKIAGEGAIGRPHIAAAMLKEELIYSFREAFDKYIGYDSPAYVEKMTLHPREVFQIILDAGGIPVLAHPGVTGIDERIPEFSRMGLRGIEAYHSEHPPPVQKYYADYARRHGLLVTGGSDFHSTNQTRAEIGSPSVPYGVVEALRSMQNTIIGKGSYL